MIFIFFLLYNNYSLFRIFGIYFFSLYIFLLKGMII